MQPLNVKITAVIQLSCLLALAALVPEAGAVTLTGGPSATPPGGGGCTSSGTLGGDSGVTLSCTVSSPGNFVDLYFGLVNDSTSNGMAMDGTGPSGSEIFRFSTSTPTSIIYTSASYVGKLTSNTTEGATTRLTLTLESGDGAAFAVDGDPADNSNGDIEALFRVSGSSFSVKVDLESNSMTTPSFTVSNSGFYDTARTSASVRSLTSLDVGFYYNECSP